jgi:hypothetical protein
MKVPRSRSGKARVESPAKPGALRRKDGRASSAPRQRRAAGAKRHARIRSIDGRHPLQQVAPSAIVSYPAGRRRDSRIVFFNFELAREIGRLPRHFPDRLDRSLEAALLDTFSLVIVNEWDEAHGRRPAARDRRPYPYMATRYLQLQHPDKRGINSGDGHSIWNGFVRGRRGRWDVSSCGTGVTRLCPATSAEGRFFRTGNALTDYGCGTAHVEEGLGAALMSEAFARNGLRTERVLAVLSLPGGLAINVRVAPNLLRPSHFFGLLRRREDDDLRRCVLYYAEREIEAKRWPDFPSERARIRYLTERVAIDFARTTAAFESDYIFCWLDWDGDNILVDGSIIDYGSVRQFGLYHHSYRFDDVDRMSTSIPQQKRKARQIVQRFAQIRELLLNGKRPALSSLRDEPVLETFDREFETHKRRLFLQKMGLGEQEAERVLARPPKSLDTLLRLHNRLERRRSSRGPHPVPDGLSWNAVYCMRDVLRELPSRLLERLDATVPRLPPAEFYALALSSYASKEDRRRTPYRDRLARDYQRAYLDLATRLARRRGLSLQVWLEEIRPTAESRNPYNRMTGDGLSHAARRLAQNRNRLAPEETYRLISEFADSQDLSRDTACIAKGDRSPALAPNESALKHERPLVRRIFHDLLRYSLDYRESL